MLIGAQEPKQFVLSLGYHIMEVHYTENFTGKGSAPNLTQYPAAISLLGSLVKQDPISLLPLLPRLVETVVRSLDPHLPYLRDSCLQATTKVLHTLVSQYPMISFHQDSQRLAVGTNDNVIVIYDLKTATRWHVLEVRKGKKKKKNYFFFCSCSFYFISFFAFGQQFIFFFIYFFFFFLKGHTGAITALSFSENGKFLSSYSIVDNQVKFWSTTAGFVIFGSTPHCVKSFAVAKVEKNVSQMNLLECVKLKWTDGVSVMLNRTWTSPITLRNS
jgi:WD40 repeat protein